MDTCIKKSIAPAQANDTLKTAAPSASVAGGEVAAATTVSLTCETAGAEIYYTVDGSNVTKEKAKYAEPISISQTTTLKAKAYAAGFTVSDEISIDYTVTE